MAENELFQFSEPNPFLEVRLSVLRKEEAFELLIGKITVHFLHFVQHEGHEVIVRESQIEDHLVKSIFSSGTLPFNLSFHCLRRVAFLLKWSWMVAPGCVLSLFARLLDVLLSLRRVEELESLLFRDFLATQVLLLCALFDELELNHLVEASINLDIAVGDVVLVLLAEDLVGHAG